MCLRQFETRSFVEDVLKLAGVEFAAGSQRLPNLGVQVAAHQLSQGEDDNILELARLFRTEKAARPLSAGERVESFGVRLGSDVEHAPSYLFSGTARGLCGERAIPGRARLRCVGLGDEPTDREPGGGDVDRVGDRCAHDHGRRDWTQRVDVLRDCQLITRGDCRIAGFLGCTTLTAVRKSVIAGVGHVEHHIDHDGSRSEPATIAPCPCKKSS